MCLAYPRSDVDDGGVATKAPIYRRTCAICERPALTLDDSGDALCGGHAEVFIAIDDAPGKIDAAEISILLMHRPLLAEIG